MGEFDLIRSLASKLGPMAKVRCGIGDDAAVLPYSKSHYLLFATDMIVEGTHFLKGTGYQLIGHKALAVNISDIAAMGGIPTYAVVSLGIPPTIKEREILQIYDGIKSIAKKFAVSVVGGDTVKSTLLTINIALLGLVERQCLVLRSGAKTGDIVYVTGPLGGSFKSGKHLNFTPSLEVGRWLVTQAKPSAMIDLSDGLAGDLGHILSQSGVGAVIEERHLPKRSGVSTREALTDGEDFELAFTITAGKAKKLTAQKNFNFYPIGRIVSGGPRLILRNIAGEETVMPLKGFEHL